MKKLFLILIVFFGTISFAPAQDTDNDGIADVDDCSPTDPAKWASVIYLDQDGDGYLMVVTGCFGALPPNWRLSANGTWIYTPYYYYNWGMLEGCDTDPYTTDGCNTEDQLWTVASGDADNDGEPDFTDPEPNNPLTSHWVFDICNGIDDNYNGVIDEDCPSGCTLTVNAGSDETTYFGYSLDQCVSKTALVNGGTSPFTYSWTLDRALLQNVINSSGDETMTGTNSPTVTVCLMDTAELCITVTDANNCTHTDCAMVFASDARCFAGNSNIQKVTVCHQGHAICVDENAVNAHMSHGDYLGSCSAGRLELNAAQTLSSVQAYPNPAKDKLTLKFKTASPSMYEISITDITGRMILSAKLKSSAGINEHAVDISQLAKGTYVLQLTSAGERSYVKIMVE